MKTRKMIRITSEMGLVWKQSCVGYLEELEEKPLPELSRALMLPGALTPRFRAKRHILLEPEAMVNEAHYLRNGLAKLYSIDPKTGDEKIFHIWEPNSIIVLYQEFRQNLPNADYYIELVADSELVTITNFCMEGIYDAFPVAHSLTQKIITIKKKRMLMQMDILLTSSKSDRLALFYEKFPGLRAKLSNDEICAFIGISPATLSSSKSQE